jgi:hypothetical protein
MIDDMNSRQIKVQNFDIQPPAQVAPVRSMTMIGGGLKKPTAIGSGIGGGLKRPTMLKQTN